MSDPLNLNPETSSGEGITSEGLFQAVISPVINPIHTLPMQAVSGKYLGTTGSYEMELRVDIDGARPCNLVSGDFYSVSGSVKTYFGSFKSGVLSVTWASGMVTITGVFSTTWVTSNNHFRITIPRTSILITAHAQATLTFLSASNVPGSTYVCAYNSPYFRSIKLEQDREVGASFLASYDTNVMPHPGTGRVLTIISAYAEAGVQMVPTAGSDTVPTIEAGPDAVWTNAELEAAMHHHFSIISDSPQWQTYLLACVSRHEQTSGGSVLFGIMFDLTGSSQRQGCAVFQTQINNFYGGAGTNDVNRHTMYCYVHELGHSFNLLHSWDKGRPNSLSWMNYDWKYDQLNGAGSYWANFNFRFDDQELVHIRHDYRNSVIMGGDNWNVNAGFGTGEDQIDLTKGMVENNSGVGLELYSKASFVLNEPVVVELKLHLNGKEEVTVNAMMHPNFDFIKLTIKKPNGEIVRYEPLVEHLCIPKMVKLDQSNPSIYESAYIGYGKDGFYFDQPGNYIIKAAYPTSDGGYVTSEDLKIRVKSPITPEEDQICDLYGGDEQGRLFYLLGSDAAHLQKGNDALKTVVDKYGDHPLCAYAALVQGINAGRDFKCVDENKQITVRKNDVGRNKEMLDKVLEMAQKGAGIDNITLNYAMRKKAECHLKNGDKKTAEATLSKMKNYMVKQGLKQHVIEHIDQQIDRCLSQPVNTDKRKNA